MADRLWVVRGGEVLADFDRDDSGRLWLRFRPEVVARSETAPLISLSVPVRAEPYEQEGLLPFFDGLLPEGLVRERLAARFRLNPADVFGLLREFGRDCAGALSIVPDGTDLKASRTSGVDWLDDEALAERVGNLANRPLADEPAAGIRISLAGALNKMAVVVRGHRIGLPLERTPSTHILKPASTERRSSRDERLKYPSLVANEAFCTVLAGRAGLVAVTVSIRPIDGEPALLIERYDRVEAGERVERIHQEDFCQALGVLSSRKYEADGGPGLADCLDLIRRTSVDVLSDQTELLDRVAFNYLVGNDDAHAKNFSVLHPAEGTRLAPAYDLLSTFIYPDLKKAMAMKINNIEDSRALQPVHWKKAFGQLGLSERLYSERFVALAARVEEAIAEVRADVQAWNLGNGTLDGLVALISKRVEVLKAVSG